MFQPRKRFGQNFLVDSVIIECIFQGLELNPSWPILEIGPGQGALTQGLLACTNFPLHCVEIDRDLAERLQAHYGKAIEVYCQDILAFDFACMPSSQGPLQVVGNLPYNLSTPILLKCLNAFDTIASMHFMLQKEVAARICAQPGSSNYGRLSVRVQVACQAKIWLDVPSTAFCPIPKVESAMVRLTPHAHAPHVDYSALDQVLRCAFSGRRKKISNSLKSLFSQDQFIQLGIVPTLRADQVSVAQFVALSEKLAQHNSAL